MAMQQKYRQPWENYRVNLVIDNDKLAYAPVILSKILTTLTFWKVRI